MAALDQRIFPGTERRRGNYQFRQIAQRRVEQAAHGVAGLFRNGFGCTTQQRGKRHDREHREDEQQCVRRGGEFCDYQCHRYKGQQPEYGIVAKLLEQRIHVTPTAAFGTPI
jgi:hypothetical protein